MERSYLVTPLPYRIAKPAVAFLVVKRWATRIPSRISTSGTLMVSILFARSPTWLCPRKRAAERWGSHGCTSVGKLRRESIISEDFRASTAPVRRYYIVQPSELIDEG